LGWSAEYQGVPRPLEGNRFKRHWFPIVDAVPYDATRVRYWDKAGTQDGGAYTSGVLIAKHEGRIYIENVVRGQWSAYERERTIKQTAEMDATQYGSKSAVKIYVEQEPGSGGKESAENTIRNLAGFSIYADRPSGDKDTRLDPFAAQAEANNVVMVRGIWNQDYVEEMVTIPNGTYRDQGDATAGAFNMLNSTQPRKYQKVVQRVRRD
jgi:predicted phage terminase large subunit-like protein